MQHTTTRRLHQDRKTKSLQLRLHHPRCCARSVQHTTLFQLRPVFPKLLNRLSRSWTSCSSEALRNCLETVFVLTCRFLFQPILIVSFPDTSILWRAVCRPSSLCERILVFDTFRIQRPSRHRISRDGLAGTATCSSFLVSRISDTTESLCHFAGSTLLSYDAVSDDFS